MVEGTKDRVREDLPPAQRHIIKRPRLYRLLDEANARIILLVAPAGYGKTTLARQWTSLRGRRAFWFGASPSSVDPAALAHGIAAALGAQFPDAAKHVEGYFAARMPTSEALNVLAELLAAELKPWPIGTWLVIDDYQAFRSSLESERLIECLARNTDIKMLITSREEPSWASPKQVLYGELVALGRDELAMNNAEAVSVLSEARRPAEDLAKAAKGWPALIGLAAMLPDEVDLRMQPELLHGYFSAELLGRVDPDVKALVPLLTLLDSLDLARGRALFGDKTEDVYSEALRVGLASTRAGGGIEIHPLVRGFLETKLVEQPPPRSVVEGLARELIDEGELENSFSLIRTYRLQDCVRPFLQRGLLTALERGLTTTIKTWLDWADTAGLEAPELSLARAELLMRRGEWHAAERIASACAPLLPARLSAEAHICAGSSAQLLDEGESATKHFHAAMSLNQSAYVQRRALWGEFLVATHSPNGDPKGALNALEQLADASPQHLVRLSHARLVEAEHGGGVATAADMALRSDALLEGVGDPLIRTGFRHNLADALVQSARYADAERIVRLELEDAERYRLDFVYPNATLVLAAVRTGQGDFVGASVLLDEVQSLEGAPDSFIDANLIGLRTRLYLSRGSLTDIIDPRSVPPDARANIYGEAIASIALARAVAGDLGAARKLIDSIESKKSFCLTRVLIAAVKSIATLTEAGDRQEPLQRLIDVAATTQAYDALLTAVRAHSGLRDHLLDQPDGAELLKVIYARSGDASLREALGLTVAPLRHSGVITRREREILARVAQGMKNDEIGRELFISPKTVKTHLQNIFEKLDAHTRTEAVVKAKTAGLL